MSHAEQKYKPWATQPPPYLLSPIFRPFGASLIQYHRNSVFHFRYLPISRLGSLAMRYTQVSPILCIHIGASGFIPAFTSKANPTARRIP